MRRCERTCPCGDQFPRHALAFGYHDASLRILADAARQDDSHGRSVRFYHRVADDRDELAVSPLRFREQMAVLAREGYRVTDVASASELLAHGECPHHLIALSFDDGYLDVAENALPVLEQYGFRATVFVVTGAADGRVSFSWYRRAPPLLTWVDIVALDRGSPLCFEAHSVTHPSLSALEDNEAWAEIVDSKSALEARLGRKVKAFCYPERSIRSARAAIRRRRRLRDSCLLRARRQHTGHGPFRASPDPDFPARPPA